MKNTSFLIMALVIFISCEEELPDQKIPDGTYHGTFQRELVWSDGDIANITMTFSGNKWNGSSDRMKYPALCRGTYSVKGDTVIFENECAWTAEFDWSLILSGKYVLTGTGNTVEFSRDYRSATIDTYTDQYILIKQE